MSLRPPATLRVATSALALGLALGVSGCGTSDPAVDAAEPAIGASASSSTPAIVLVDGWVKAVDAADPKGSTSPSPSPSASGGEDMAGVSGSAMGRMSAMFGVLRNTSGQDVIVTGASSPVAGRVELHETVKNGSGAMQMQHKDGGFVIAAGESMTLQPGGNHVMLMGLTGDLATGSDVSVTLQTTAGEVSMTVPVRAFTGAEESYAPSPASS